MWLGDVQARSVWPSPIQFNSIFFILPGYHIQYNNLILIYNVVQTRNDETNNILCTTRQTGHT